MTELLRIDVKQALYNKSPRLASKIPAFLIRYLCRIVHQDELNGIIERYRDMQGIAFMQALVSEFGLTLELHGEENLPDGGQYIFASNHPLGGLDGICLAATLGRRYNSAVRYLVNDLLMFIPNLQSIFVPINKHGAHDRNAAAKIEDIFRSDNQVITFPAGLCSRKINGRIYDLPWKKSFIQKAIAHRRDVIPVYFDGRNSTFFYRLANIRKRLCVKLNIEMLYLPDEMFRNRNQTFRIYFGTPIPWQTFDRTRKPSEWAEWVKKRVYLLNEY
ncbi:MAG: 1-acyl-sn-glycerol-3-phosphate acyltransferase [Prevotellaceae bacterium]|jgi:putative hemolysin|nr:1-acyl-sn-glycerol-3-phosphate acyltransferase [Prevotellaceae bacterium]